jgi:Ca2+-binding RTX toxin-like protein
VQNRLTGTTPLPKSRAYINNGGDLICETSGNGYDKARSTLSHTLRFGIEELVRIAGSQANNGTGNDLNNKIVGNASANILSGRAGTYTLFGGAGADQLFGTDGNDWLYGGASGDVLLGDAGCDTLAAGIEDDLIIITGPS